MAAAGTLPKPFLTWDRVLSSPAMTSRLSGRARSSLSVPLWTRPAAAWTIPRAARSMSWTEGIPRS